MPTFYQVIAPLRIARHALRPWLPDASLETWDETSITPGQNWRQRLQAALAGAQVLVVLVSEGFLESDRISTHLLPPLLAAASRKDALLLPVQLEACAFKESVLGRYPLFNDQEGEFASYPLFNDPTITPDPFATHEQGLLEIQLSRYLREIVDAPFPLARTQRLYQGHRDWVRDARWSPDGLLVASGGDDGRAHIWDARTGERRVTCDGSGEILSLAWAPDGLRVAAVIYGAPPKYQEDSLIQVWEASSGKTLLAYRGHAQVCASLAWSPDGTHLASGDAAGMIHLWEAETGKRYQSWNGHCFLVNALAWSPDGLCLASAGDDHKARLWEAATGALRLTYQGHTDRVQTVAWSPDGTRLASGSWEHQAHLWEASSGKRLLSYQGHAFKVLDVAWSPDGANVASGSADHTVQVWSASTGEPLLTYTGHSEWARSVAWSPDGILIASGSYDGTVQIWSAVQ